MSIPTTSGPRALYARRWVPAPMPPVSSSGETRVVLCPAPPPRFAPWDQTLLWAKAALHEASSLLEQAPQRAVDLCVSARVDLILAIAGQLATHSGPGPSRLLALSSGPPIGDGAAHGLLAHLARNEGGMLCLLVHRGGADTQHMKLELRVDSGPSRRVERLVILHGGSDTNDSRVDALAALAGDVVVLRSCPDPMVVAAKTREAVVRMGGVDGAVHLAAENFDASRLLPTPRQLARRLQPGLSALRALHVALPGPAWILSCFRDRVTGGAMEAANAGALAVAAANVRTRGQRRVVSVAHQGTEAPADLARLLLRASVGDEHDYLLGPLAKPDPIAIGVDSHSSLSSADARGPGHREPRAPLGSDHPV